MSEKIEHASENAITQSNIARVIPSKELDTLSCFKWISLAINDFINAKMISLAYGLIFTLLPLSIYFLVKSTAWYIPQPQPFTYINNETNKSDLLTLSY